MVSVRKPKNVDNFGENFGKTQNLSKFELKKGDFMHIKLKPLTFPIDLAKPLVSRSSRLAAFECPRIPCFFNLTCLDCSFEKPFFLEKLCSCNKGIYVWFG